MNLNIKSRCAILILVFSFIIKPVYAAGVDVTTLGNDLSANQKKEMLDLFNVTEADNRVLYVTNQEERNQLSGLVSNQTIGTKAISSVYVKLLSTGKGIEVKTKNISVVTKQAYANALVTAGIKDAEIYAAAPFPVSGTAALTGLFKAYEEAKGEPISEEAKKVSTEELTTTSEVGQEAGDLEGVSQLMQNVKEKMLEGDITDPQDLKELIEKEAGKLGLNLSDGQIDKLINILLKIKDLNIDLGSLKSQLTKYLDNEGVQRIWQQVTQFLTGLWQKISELF